MKLNKYSICLLLMAISLVAFSQEGNYTLEGTLKGIPDGDVDLSVYDMRSRTSQKIGTAKVVKGQFIAKGKLSTPQMITLIFKPGNWGTQIFLENNFIRVKLDTSGSKHYDHTRYGGEKGANLQNVEVEGSISHRDFGLYRASTGGITEKGAYLAAQLGYIRPYISKNPSSTAGVYMLSDHYLYNSTLPLNELDQMVSAFRGVALKSVYYRNLQKELAERRAVLPGNLAEDFTLMKPDSTKFTLSSLRGKYVMIDFWASWCKPCREAIPHWKELYSKYRNRGFEIVGVSNDNKWPAWKMALEEEKMPWIQVADEFPLKNMPARVVSKYKYSTIPLYVLLDRQGKILLTSTDKNEIDQKLEVLFGK